MTRTRWTRIALVAVLFASACSGSKKSPPVEQPPTVTVSIPPSGGSLVLKEPDGQQPIAELAVPANVLPSTQTVKATQTTGQASLPDGAKSSLVVFEPRIQLPANAQGESAKVSLKVPAGTPPGSATIYWERWEQANTYDPLSTTVETKDGITFAVADISHLSSGFVGSHCPQDVACPPAGTECREGAWVCTSGRPVCEAVGPSPDGTACGKIGDAGVCAAGACVKTPVIQAFTATPAVVERGGAVVLAWTVSNADSLSISPDVGPVTGTSATVRPASTTTYTLTATNAAGSQTAQVTVTAVPPVRIVSFTAVPSIIAPGGTATLSWDVTGADTISIDNGIGLVTGTSRTVSPGATTTYRLTAANAVGSATKDVTVSVMPLPVIAAFTATPAVVVPGSASTLAWTVTGATTLTIDNGVGTVTGTSVTVNPTVTTTYTLTATNEAGSSTGQVTVTVVPRVVISSFTAAPSTIAPGGTATLSWSVTNADMVSIDNGIGTVTGTSRTVSPTTTTVYHLTATNAASSATASVTVTVTAVPVISAFTATPATVAPSGTSTLAWTVSGATTLSIDNGIGTVTGTSRTVTPSVTTTYTLTAANAGGSSTRQVTVTVVPRVVIDSFTATPATINLGGSSTLTWSVTNADTLSIDNGIGTVTGTSRTVSPTTTTRYTLTATNSVTSATASVLVTVNALPVISSFMATPATIGAEGSSTLSWTVSGATSLSIDNGIGTVTGTSIVVRPTVSTTYVLTAVNSIGSTTASVRVGVNPLSVAPVYTTLTGSYYVDPNTGQRRLQCNVPYRFTNSGSETATTTQVTYRFVSGCGNTVSYAHHLGVAAGSTVTSNEWAWCPSAFSVSLSFQYGVPSSSSPLSASAATVSCTAPAAGIVGFASTRDARERTTDFDGDGIPDTFALDRGQGRVLVLLGKGDGSFGPAVRHPVGSAPIFAVAADVDGDGRTDLVVVNELSNDLAILLGNGDGSFREVARQPVGGRPVHLAVGDLNGDGRPDLVVANSDADSITVLLGVGDGTFRSLPDLPAGDRPEAVALGDLDGDGRSDAVVLGSVSGTLSIYRGGGDGTFQPSAVLALSHSPGPGAVALADVDGDGRLDAVVVSEASSTVAVLLGNGDGTFRPAYTYDTGASPVAVLVADLDADGNPDVATANLGGGSVSIFRGQGNGAFAPREDQAAPGARALSIGDFNRDGALDVAVADGSGVVSVIDRPFGRGQGGGR